jgi:predicted ATPase/transcriptional regulator with XRE-family HTH domain
MDDASFGHWLQLRRKALRLSRTELAHQIGCATITLRKIEADERRPSQHIATRLAEHLHLALHECLTFVKVARGELGVHRLTLPDQVVEQPALAPSTSLRTNIPIPATPLVGRAREVEHVCALLRTPDVRLITLTGPGGVGKTRLALQVASEALDDFASGVAFVTLAPVTDPSLVIPTVAHTLGVQGSSGQPLLETLITSLRGQQVLLVLDNFEQVLHAAPLVAALLRAAPQLGVLVTSQVVLRLSGEHEYPVPPLALPPPTDDQRPLTDGAKDILVGDQSSAVGQYAAVQLFVARAQAVQPAFALTEANAASVAAICRWLDGLPLAIELAATRIKLFPPKALLERLNDRLYLLTGGARDLPVRQQTLRATIDWSYNLLTLSEQGLFMRLAVFVGGWTLEAATAVCDRDGDLGLDILDGLQILIDHSLMRQEEGPDGAPHFRLLETIREYALELLAASGEENALRRRHAEYFCALAEEAEHYQYGPLDALWMKKLNVDYDNMCAAMAWSSGREGDLTIALRLIAALLEYWLNRQPFSEALPWAEAVLAIPQAALFPALQAKALNTAGTIMSFKGDPSHSEPLLLKALALYEVLTDHYGCSEVLNHLGLLNGRAGRLTAAVGYQQASIQRAERAGSTVRLAWAYSALGQARLSQGQYELAVAACSESLAFGVLHGIYYHMVCTALAGALYHVGDTARAVALLDTAIPELRGSNANFIGDALLWRARIASAYGDQASAEALLGESQVLAQEQGATRQLAHSHYELGLLTRERGDAEHANRHFHQSLTLFRAQQNPWCMAVVLLGVGLTALLLGDHAAAACHYTESVTLLRDWRENLLARQAALVVGLSGLLLARPLSSTVVATQAARILGLVAVLAPLTGGKLVTPPFLRLPQPDPALGEAALSEVRRVLGDTTFNAAYAAGQALTLEQAIAYALEG